MLDVFVGQSLDGKPNTVTRARLRGWDDVSFGALT